MARARLCAPGRLDFDTSGGAVCVGAPGKVQALVQVAGAEGLRPGAVLTKPPDAARSFL